MQSISDHFCRDPTVLRDRRSLHSPRQSAQRGILSRYGRRLCKPTHSVPSNRLCSHATGRRAWEAAVQINSDPDVTERRQMVSPAVQKSQLIRNRVPTSSADWHAFTASALGQQHRDCRRCRERLPGSDATCGPRPAQFGGLAQEC